MKKIFTLIAALAVCCTAVNAEVLLDETFNKCTGTGADPTATTANSTAVKLPSTVLDANWATATYVYPCYHIAKMGSSSAAGILTSDALAFTAGTTYSVQFKAAGWSTDRTKEGYHVDTLYVNVYSANGDTLQSTLLELPNNEWGEYNVPLTNVAAGSKVSFETSVYSTTSSTGKVSKKASRAWIDDIVIAAGYSATVPAAPKFSIASGEFTTAQSVAISAADGASIYYTTDGSVPTVNSTLYTGAITIDKTASVRAIAVVNGAASIAVSETYVILPSVANIAAAREVATGETINLTLNDAIVCATSSAAVWVIDASGKGLMINGCGLNMKTNAYGDHLNGTIIGTMNYSTSNGVYMAKANATVVTTVSSQAGAAPEAVNKTWEELAPNEDHKNADTENYVSTTGYVLKSGTNYYLCQSATEEDPATNGIQIFYTKFTTQSTLTVDSIAAFEGQQVVLKGIYLIYGTKYVQELCPITKTDIAEYVPTGINDVKATEATKARKVIENGQIFIVAGDKKFNIMGVEVK